MNNYKTSVTSKGKMQSYYLKLPNVIIWNSLNDCNKYKIVYKNNNDLLQNS